MGDTELPEALKFKPRDITSSSDISTIMMSSPKFTLSNTTLNFTTTSVSTSNTTSISTPHSKNITDLFHISTTAAIGIGLAVFVIIGVCAFIYFYLYKKGKLSCNTCKNYVRIRRRTNSMTSQMTENDPTFVVGSQAPRQERELFSIGDQDGGEDGRPNSFRRRGTEDDYFYDEIFERSAFVDESTQRANKQLTVDNDDELERGILDELEAIVPDLEFKKPSSRF